MENEIYTLILTDSNLQAKLMLAFKKSYSTIRRWAVTRNEMLTSLKAQKIYKEMGINIESAELSK
jgi:hypothetical protein